MKEIISKATIGPVLFHSELAKEAATIFAPKYRYLQNTLQHTISTKACVSKIAIDKPPMNLFKSIETNQLPAKVFQLF